MGRIRRDGLMVETADPLPEFPSLAVIIPARNEESRIGACLAGTNRLRSDALTPEPAKTGCAYTLLPVSRSNKQTSPTAAPSSTFRTSVG